MALSFGLHSVIANLIPSHHIMPWEMLQFPLADLLVPLGWRLPSPTNLRAFGSSNFASRLAVIISILSFLIMLHAFAPMGSSAGLINKWGKVLIQAWAPFCAFFNLFLPITALQKAVPGLVGWVASSHLQLIFIHGPFMHVFSSANILFQLQSLSLPPGHLCKMVVCSHLFHQVFLHQRDLKGFFFFHFLEEMLF